MSDELYDKTLMVHDWPECGPGSLSVEDLYRAFKARLMRELAVDMPMTSHYGRLTESPE